MTITSLDAVLRRIETAPAGPKIGAFFDLDGTILSGFSAAAFYSDRLRRGDVSAGELARTAALAVDGQLGGDLARLAELSVGSLRGESDDHLAEQGERLFAQKIGPMIRRQAREVVRAHQRRGHTVVIASSATRFQVGPVARDLGVEHIVCSQLEIDGGLLTGRFAEGGMLWGEAKARAVRAFARRKKVAVARSFAYANGAEDAAFLSTVGNPTAVNPETGLVRIAEQQQWPVVVLDDPGRRGFREAVAAVAALGGLNIGLAIGLGIGALRGDERLGADLGVALGTQSYFALAGVKLEVTGRQNMFSARPCVFVMNHQSAMDALIVMTLAQGGLSGMGKKEAKYLPPTYLLSRAMNTVWVDRNDSAAARLSQKELVQRLEQGLSVMVAPEGTRQPTPVLGPFRTGAFHVALEAGVPVVPIIVRNAYDLQPGAAKTSRSGVVQIAVLDPIPTDTWSKDTIHEHVADVRQRFVNTLDDWPEGE